MAKCFLSYSSAYAHLKEPFRNLLESLGFDVDVFDGPDTNRPAQTIIEKRIQDDDAVVVLYGPSQSLSEKSPEVLKGADWPTWEAMFAYSIRKPLALILHPGTQLPEFLRDYQTPARFEFWDSSSFLNNIHHIVKHILDLKRQVDLPPGTQPHIFTKTSVRNRISSSGFLAVDVYHEVIARQSCSIFEHSFDTNGDSTQEASFGPLTSDSYEIEATQGGDIHSVSIKPKKNTTDVFEYFVEVTPPLRPGELLGYRRRFEIPNRFPLTQSELLSRACKDGFPTSIFEQGFYGDVFDVLYDIESLALAIYFPRRVKLGRRQVRVIHYKTGQDNVLEGQRCQQYLQLKEDPENPERIIELIVPRPLFNHSYALLYEPLD